MTVIADRVKETTATTGTGTISMGGAVQGFRTFASAFATANIVSYCLADATNWEVGLGTLTTGAPWTMARTTVLASSNAGALVNFPGPSTTVFCTVPASQALTLGGALGTPASGSLLNCTLSATQTFSAINGQSNSDWYRTSGATGWYNSTYAVGMYSTGASWVQTYNGASLQVNGNMYATANVVAYYSDSRLKEVLGNIPNALSKVCSLNGVIYKNNDLAASFGYTSKDEQVGVIAQEVKAVQPQVVCSAPFDIGRNEDGTEFSISGENYTTVQYERLVPLLIEAIKELTSKVAVLEGKTL